MFYKSILLALTLCVYVVAHPVQQPRNIPLQKRTIPKTKEGVMDLDKLRADTNRTISKHQQNRINRQRNAQIANSTNTSLGQSGAAIRIAPSNHPRSAIHARQFATEPLSDQSNGLSDGIVWVGTPHQAAAVLIDTGSSDLWFMSPSCTSSSCNGRPKYDPDQSSSVAFQSGSFSIEYGSGPVTGFLVTDLVVIAGIPVWNQWLACATNAEIGSFQGSGILGMAYRSLSAMNQNPWINNAVEQGAVTTAEFALKLANEDPVLTIGGTDPSLYNGNPEFHPVQTESGCWKVGSGTLFLNSNQIINRFNAIFDSGTSTIIAPMWATQQIYSQVPGAMGPMNGGLYTFPCSNIPSISFSFANKQQWTIPTNIFNLGRASNGQCVGAIIGVDEDPEGDNDAWVIGRPFMESFYMIFKFETNDVGIAELK